MTAVLFTAACAAWFSTRRRYLFPFAERLLWFCSALSSFPGQVPTQEVNSAAEAKVLAWHPPPRSPAVPNPLPNRAFRQSDHGVLMRLHGLRDHAIELGNLLIDQLQPLQL